MIPVRFVVACEEGHIDDFPWEIWAHSSSSSLESTKLCDKPSLRLEAKGRAGLEGLVVNCIACGSKRSLRGSAGPRSLEGLPCTGHRPWLGPNARETCTCEKPARMLQRGATNIYFPKVASSIVIPPYSNRAQQVLDQSNYWGLLTSGLSDGEVDQARVRIVADMCRVPFQDLLDAFTSRRMAPKPQPGGQTEEQFRYAEFDALLHRSGSSDGLFMTSRPQMSEYTATVQQYLDSVVLVEKLTETRALTGFSRIVPPPYREFEAADQLKLSRKRQDWLPAVRVSGEGIFLSVKETLIADWAEEEVNARYEEMSRRYIENLALRGRSARPLSARFYFLHSLAHALIRRLSFDCGYGSASLRERVYSSENDPTMAGILIYTAAGDADGTMGGLVRVGKPGAFDRVLIGAITDSLWCSSDPLCIGSHGQGPDSVNRAACYACSLLPETSCEEGNRFLDRVALVGLPENRELGFFSALVERLLKGTF